MLPINVIASTFKILNGYYLSVFHNQSAIADAGLNGSVNESICLDPCFTSVRFLMLSDDQMIFRKTLVILIGLLVFRVKSDRAKYVKV